MDGQQEDRVTEPLHLHGDVCRFCGSAGRCSCNPPPWEELRRLAYTLDQLNEARGLDRSPALSDVAGIAEAVRGIADDLDPDARRELDPEPGRVLRHLAGEPDVLDPPEPDDSRPGLCLDPDGHHLTNRHEPTDGRCRACGEVAPD